VFLHVITKTFFCQVNDRHMVKTLLGVKNSGNKNIEYLLWQNVWRSLGIAYSSTE